MTDHMGTMLVYDGIQLTRRYHQEGIRQCFSSNMITRMQSVDYGMKNMTTYDNGEHGRSQYIVGKVLAPVLLAPALQVAAAMVRHPCLQEGNLMPHQ